MNYDQDQIKAIKSLDNTLVIAGAGSGKTTTIIGKVEYLIKNNLYKDDEILIISFTNEAVKSIKRKINNNIDVLTFHKLALNILNNKEISISSNYDLKYIIKEYLLSYATYNKKTNRIYKRILKKTNLNKIVNLIYSFINIYKCNYSDISYLFNLYKKSYFTDRYYLKIILDIYIIYKRELESTKKVDFNDMIINATQIINKNEKVLKYKYIIVDEFQDSSLIRFNLLKSIIDKNKGKLFVVGDDYQSIYRFSGCDLSLFLNFESFIKNSDIIYLNNNYRNNQNLIDVANKFIMRNKKQIKKRTICHKNSSKSIKVVFYKNKELALIKLLNTINTKILILGRNNADKDAFKIKENERIKFLTIHKSKGLEEENVILINLYNSISGFPSHIKNHRILNKILHNDYIIHEEERRLFYVALTRTKNNVFLLTPKTNYSVFIKELLFFHKKYIEVIHID